LGGSGDQYSYVNYSFNFDGTYQLSQGDTVGVFALIYGYSIRNSGLGPISGGLNTNFNNFTWLLETPVGGTTFDITETP
jgi:hypothetical protein